VGWRSERRSGVWLLRRGRVLYAFKKQSWGCVMTFYVLLYGGNSPHGYSFRPSTGASGGLLTMWDTATVEV
jgi:hypothetical protein